MICSPSSSRCRPFLSSSSEAMMKEKAPPPSSKLAESHPEKQKKVPGFFLTLTKDVLSLLALSIFFVPFVTIHLKSFGVSADLILDTSGNDIHEDTKYYIVPKIPDYSGLTSTSTDNGTCVSATKDSDLVQPVTFSFPNSRSICIQFDSKNKWWVFKGGDEYSVMVSNDANKTGDLFTIKEVAGHSSVPAYVVGFNNSTLGIGYGGRVMIQKDNDTLFQVMFEKVQD